MALSLTEHFLKVNTMARLYMQGEIAAARYLVQHVFRDMKDRQGAPYLDHLEQVAANVDDRSKPYCLMHDLREKFPQWIDPVLKTIGFSQFTRDGVTAMTRPNDKNYFPHIVDFTWRPEYFAGKDSDWTHNCDPARREPNDPFYDERIAKYNLCRAYRNDFKNGVMPAGTNFPDWIVMTGRSSEENDHLLAKFNSPISKSPAPQPSPALVLSRMR